MSITIVIDGAAIHKHENLRRKFLICAILCKAMEVCHRIIVAFSRTEINNENVLIKEIKDLCLNIEELYDSVLKQYEDIISQLSMNGISNLLMGIYGIVKYRLSEICNKEIHTLISEGVRMDKWSEIVSRAFDTYLKKCISENLMDDSKFRDTLAGDFENWLKQVVNDLCKQHDTKMLVLTHDDGIEIYVPSICNCYTKAIRCKLNIEVIKDKCECVERDLILKIVGINW